MRRTWLIWAVVGLSLAAAAGARAEVGWMIYPYRIPAKDEDYQRLLNCKEAEYLGFQWVARGAYTDDLEKQRAAELARAGKKIIAQLWFGAGKPFSWRRFNMPNIALDPVIRQEFFDTCTDPYIEHWGPKNLYAVHLMEETGMQFGWEADEAGYPDDPVGYDNHSCWDNPASWEWGRNISGPYVLNIRKYNDLFRKETGLDMRLAPIWSNAEKERYRVWSQQTMEAGAHIQFAKHVHEKYPGIKVYAFNSGPALIPQGQALDGQFIDPYSGHIAVFETMRKFRAVMRPEMDLVAMMWGNRQKVVAQRMPQQAVCYLGGADILSTFGDHEETSDEYLNIVRDSVRPFLGLPRFEYESPVLFLGGRGSGAVLNWSRTWLTGFAKYDYGTEATDLDKYQMVVGWGDARHPDLEEWVRAGGILVGVHFGGEMLTEAGLLEDLHERVNSQVLEYKPDEWLRENFRLAEAYQLEIGPVGQYAVQKPDLVHQDQFLYVAQYGKGLVVFMPAWCYVHAPWKYEDHWEVYRQLLTDVCRGALIYRNLPETADECFCDPELGNDYMKMTSKDGSLTVYVLLNDVHGPHKSQTSFVVPGHDRVTGQKNVTFGEEHPVVVIENR
ncbi:MAG: hypothetical protein GX100_10860 [candidate division WS1 bacterium]|nr:hypothetical protein [candidate division WS1 bacterium]